MLKTFILICAFSGFAAAQPFGAGLKVGVPLSDALNVKPSNLANYAISTNRYAIGPFVEIRLPARFAVEVDALYRSYDFSSPAGHVGVGSWEFPVLAKYKLLGGPIRPYIEGGLVLSHLSVRDVVELNHRSNYGIALGAGLEIHALFLRVSPEIRYDGFVFRNFDSPGGILQSNRNQAMVLVGIGF